MFQLQLFDKKVAEQSKLNNAYTELETSSSKYVYRVPK